jgi:hypothetical protein
LPSFMQNFAQTKRNTKSIKHSCKNNVYSQHGVMWQTDAICLRMCDLGLISFTEGVTTITVQELSNITYLFKNHSVTSCGGVHFSNRIM